MDQGKEYLCTLQPLEPYFLGGERNFHFGPVEKESKADYYLISEDVPQQSSIFGMLRFLLLEKAGMLDARYYGSDAGKRQAASRRHGEIQEQQAALIGREGFSADRKDAPTDYGKLYSISPLFLAHEADDGLHLLIRTPLNHRVKESAYHPFSMKGGFCTDLGEDTLLPADYVAKDELADSYLDLSDGSILQKSGIFEEDERTRIGRGLDEKGYFKMRFKMLRKGFRFVFFCRAEAGALPEASTAFLGQGKSTFAFRAQEAGSPCFSDAIRRIQGLPGSGREHIAVYCAVSDVFLDLTRALQEKLAYSIIETRSFRSLIETGKAETYVTSRKKSQLYQLIRAGSVFYVRDADAEAFENAFRMPGLRQAGFNCIETLGGIHG